MTVFTPVKIPNIDGHKPLKDAMQTRDKAQRKLDELMALAEQARKEGRSLPSGVADEARAASNLVRDASLVVSSEGQQAASLARTTLASDPAYRQLVGATVKALTDRLSVPLAYAALVRQAGVIKLTPLPDYAAAEIRELVAWVGQLRREGLLDSVPPALAALIPVKAAP